MVQLTDDVVIIGDGPMGLTAALYLSKNGMGVHVLGKDQTPMHKALLRNHPAAPDVPGEEWIHVLREQCLAFGARLHHQKVVGIQCDGEIFVASTEGGDKFRGRYLVLATGRNTRIAESVGVAMTDEGVAIDLHGRTSQENVYAGGNLARGITQAAISAGDGAAVALDILSREKGAPFHDYDVAPAQQPSRRAA
jgi:thioredoxin reductase (NADPH)